ncbi:MAG: hypothetical protein V7L26_13090 [Nostoc sp.]|uniref:hypothetical protein n=1 Tax=Nostoc sp. TaxID=1180 RepID=UPI002FF0BEEB
MKSLLKYFIKQITKTTLEISYFPRKYYNETDLLYNHNFYTDRLQQIIIINQWREYFLKLRQPLKLKDVSFKIFSGNGQDGILLYLLTILGIKHYTIIDIGCGNGINGNSANLIINHGFHGLLIDGDQASLDRGIEFYLKLALPSNNTPNFVNGILIKENVNSIISSSLCKDEVDVLSIDIDSIDLYILDSIFCTIPRIIVLEFNNAWGPTDSKSVPYHDGFTREWVDGLLYGGASLEAFNKILKAKGYWLIGCDPSGFDAYFIREGEDIFPEVSVQSCYEQSRAWQTTHAKLLHSRLNQKVWVDI